MEHTKVNPAEQVFRNNVDAIVMSHQSTKNKNAFSTATCF